MTSNDSSKILIKSNPNGCPETESKVSLVYFSLNESVVGFIPNAHSKYEWSFLDTDFFCTKCGF